MSTDWTVWLGPAASELTNEQREHFEAEATVILDRWPADRQDQGDADAALSAMVQYLLGEISIDEAGARRTALRAAAQEASIVAQTVARLAVLDGMPEAEAARRAGLDRMTVRKALGK